MVDLALLLPVFASSFAPAAPPATIAELDKLVGLYRSCDLPFPPKDAPLVKGEARGLRSEKGETFSAAYLLERDKTDGGRWVFCGTQRIHEDGGDVTVVPPTVETAKHIITYAFVPPFYEDGALAFAAIEHTRGHDAFALEMLRRAKEEPDFFSAQDGLAPPDGASLEVRVAFLAMQHWTNEIVQPDSDRKVVAEHMRQVFTREPKVANKENKETLRRLELTVGGRYSGGDEDEALIDKFCDSRQTGSRLQSPDPSEKRSFEPLLAVVYRGFEAVPTLLRHLGDERLTRAVHPAFMNAPTTLCTVGEVCCSLLSEYADSTVDSWLTEESRKALEAWWERTSKIPEREYCLKCLSAPGGGFPSDALIFMAEKRHLDVLPIAYQAALDSKRNVQISPYLEAMERIGLPKDQIIQRALAATEGEDLDAVHAGLWTLSRTSPPTFDVEMARTLRRLGSHATGEAWLSMESSFSQLAVLSNSDDVWKALTEATRRADPDLRIELLNHSSYTSWTPARRKRWFAYLLEFLNDDAKPAPVRKAPRSGEPPVDNHPFLATRNVGDTAALLAARELALEPIPTFKDSAAAWAEFRSRVKEGILAAVSKG